MREAGEALQLSAEDLDAVAKAFLTTGFSIEEIKTAIDDVITATGRVKATWPEGSVARVTHGGEAHYIERVDSAWFDRPKDEPKKRTRKAKVTA